MMQYDDVLTPEAGQTGDYPNGATPNTDTSTTDKAPQTPTRAHFIAVMIIVAGLAMGVIGNTVFYGNAVGINVPIFVTAYVGCGLGLALYLKAPVFLANFALTIPAIFCAVMLTLSVSPAQTTLNTGLMLMMLMLAFTYGGTSRFLGGRSGRALLVVFDIIFVEWIRAPLFSILESRVWFRTIKIGGENKRHAVSVMRGLVLTVPILLIFGGLLSSADVVFAGLMDDVIAWITPNTPTDTLWQLGMIVLFAWLSIIGFRLLLTEPDPVEDVVKPAEKPKRLLRISRIESGILLGGMNLMFMTFMVIQARYLFGGEANINTQGLTYAQYARRGFWELLMVACMVTLMTLILDKITTRDRENDRLFRGLTLAMIALTMLLSLSALYRLYIYENAYGYTRIRVMSGAFMLWLGVLLVFLAHDIARNRSWFWVGCVVVVFGFTLTLNVLNVDRFIATQNVNRWENGETFDVAYIASLSDDAVPIVIDLLDHPELTASQRETILTRMGWRLHWLDNWQESRGVFGYHVSRERAWQALNAEREALQDYIAPRPSYFSGDWSWYD